MRLRPGARALRHRDLFGGGRDTIEQPWNLGPERRRQQVSSRPTTPLAEKGKQYHDYMVDRLVEYLDWWHEGSLRPGHTVTHLTTDVLVVGAGGAGMYAAIAAAERGARLLLDKNLIGRGGATIMAQMTVAAAIGHEEPDDWALHLEDTLEAGRGICTNRCRRWCASAAPNGSSKWTSGGPDGLGKTAISSRSAAPGHRRKRCCYVDFLSTGPAVAGTLAGRSAMERSPSEQRRGDSNVCGGGHVRGAAALDIRPERSSRSLLARSFWRRAD